MATSLRKNFIVLLLSRGLVLALALVNALLLARYLGPYDFGMFSYAVGVTTIVFGWADLGLSSYAARQFQLQPARRRGVLRGFATITVRMGLLLSIGVIAGALWFGKDRVVSWALAVACVAQFFRGLSVPWRALLSSEERIPEIGFQEFSVRLGTTVLLVAVATARQGVLAMLWATAIPVVVGYWWLRRQTKGLADGDSEPVALRSMLCEAWPFTLYAIVYAVYFQIDIVLLEKLQPLDVVGYYGAATRFIYPLLQVPAALMLSAFPKLVAVSQVGTTEEGRRLRVKLLRTLLGTACLAAVALAMLAPWIVPMLLGPKYNEAVVTLQIMTLFLPLTFGQTLAANILMASGRGRELAAIYGIGLVANVGLNLWLIPLYAHNGCAIATVGGEAVVVAVSAFLLCARPQPPQNEKRIQHAPV
jgi:O-antigen/teichoic acid export membrane protein